MKKISFAILGIIVIALVVMIGNKTISTSASKIEDLTSEVNKLKSENEKLYIRNESLNNYIYKLKSKKNYSNAMIDSIKWLYTEEPKTIKVSNITDKNTVFSVPKEVLELVNLRELLNPDYNIPDIAYNNPPVSDVNTYFYNIEMNDTEHIVRIFNRELIEIDGEMFTCSKYAHKLGDAFSLKKSFISDKGLLEQVYSSALVIKDINTEIASIEYSPYRINGIASIINRLTEKQESKPKDIGELKMTYRCYLHNSYVDVNVYQNHVKINTDKTSEWYYGKDIFDHLLGGFCSGR